MEPEHLWALGPRGVLEPKFADGKDDHYHYRCLEVKPTGTQDGRLKRTYLRHTCHRHRNWASYPSPSCLHWLRAASESTGSWPVWLALCMGWEHSFWSPSFLEDSQVFMVRVSRYTVSAEGIKWTPQVACWASWLRIASERWNLLASPNLPWSTVKPIKHKCYLLGFHFPKQET